MNFRLFLLLFLMLTSCTSFQLNNENTVGNKGQIISVPQSDFTIQVPLGWDTELAAHPLIPEPVGLFIKQTTQSEIDYIVFPYHFREWQDPQQVRESFFEQNNITTYQTFYVQGMEGQIGHSPTNMDNEVNHLGIVMAEKQLLIFAEYNLPANEIEESTIILNQLLNSTSIGEEHEYQPQLLERQSLGESGFTLQRLENHYLRPVGSNTFRMENLMDPFALILEFRVIDFDNEQSANEWLSKKIEGSEKFEQLSFNQNEIKGYLVQPLSDPVVGIKELAFLKANSQGVEVTLISRSIPQIPNENVIRLVIQSIEWEQ